MSYPLPVKGNWNVGDDFTPAAANDIGDAINAMALQPQSVHTTSFTALPGSLTPCDASGGVFSVSLPLTPLDSTRVAFIKIDSSNHEVSILTSGSDVINYSGGPTSTTLAVQDQVLQLQYAATPGIWYVISGGASVFPGGTGLQVFGEVPSGTKNGSNTTFGLSNFFVTGSTCVYRNGLREQLGVGYSESSPNINFTTAPLSSDVITVDYLIS